MGVLRSKCQKLQKKHASLSNIIIPDHKRGRRGKKNIGKRTRAGSRGVEESGHYRIADRGFKAHLVKSG